MSADPVSLSDVPASAVQLHQTCLLVWCPTIDRTCWCCASLSAMPAGEVCHYRPCLLVWCSTIDRACYCCGASLSAMPAGRYVTIGHACWNVATASDILIVEWRWKRDAIKCNSIRHASLGSFIQLCVLVKYSSTRQGIWYVTNTLNMPTRRVPLPLVCKNRRLPSWIPTWIYQTLSYAWVASLGCYKADICNSRLSKISILNANPWTRPASVTLLSLFFCNKLLFWRPSCLHSYFIHFHCVAS